MRKKQENDSQNGRQIVDLESLKAAEIFANSLGEELTQSLAMSYLHGDKMADEDLEKPLPHWYYGLKG